MATFTIVSCNTGRGSFAGSRPINSADTSDLANRFNGPTEVFVDPTPRDYPQPGPNDHVGFGDQGAVESLNTFGGQNRLPPTQYTQYTTARPFFTRPTIAPGYQKTGYGSFNGGYGGNQNNRGYGGYGGYNKNQINRGYNTGSYGGGYRGNNNQNYQNSNNHQNNRVDRRQLTHQNKNHQNTYYVVPLNQHRRPQNWQNSYKRNRFDEIKNDESEFDIRMYSNSDNVDDGKNDQIFFRD